MSDQDHSPVTPATAEGLFAAWAEVPVMVVAVSGGPDSTALLWLLSRWRAARRTGPRLFAVTVDHGLRAEGAREARTVKALARDLGIAHRTMRWSGAKPQTGVPAAARAARYDLLAKAAKAFDARHIMTAHTRDDQAETVVMRLARGSGIAGLAAMARETTRNGLTVVRPLLDVTKASLIATLQDAGIPYAVDPSNSDARFTRPRLRELMPRLAAEGCDSRNLSRLAWRLGRANAALEIMADSAERELAMATDPHKPGLDRQAFAALTDEIQVRLLLRMINRVASEGPVELGKVEGLVAELANFFTNETGVDRYRRTLAGALISATRTRLRVEIAPPRRK